MNTDEKEEARRDRSLQSGSRDGMSLGLGTGSTVSHTIIEIGQDGFRGLIYRLSASPPA